MSELSPQRRKVVVLCAAVACMSSGSILLKGHPKLLLVWITVMVVALVYAIAGFAKLKRQEP